MKTQPDLAIVTDQGLFDATVLHLAAQGEPSRIGDGCYYRHPAGFRCAVGFHLTDDEYEPDMEHQNAAAIKLPSRLTRHKGLLTRMQEAHDNWDMRKNNLREEMCAVARDFDLNPKVLSLLKKDAS